MAKDLWTRGGLLAVAGGFALAAAVAQGAEFHVDAVAGHGGDGSRARPWRTVGEAVEGIRAARKAGHVKVGEAVELCFRPGDYPVTGVTLTAADSGTAEAPVTWRTVGAGRARLMGGVRVPPSHFRKVTDPSVWARLPENARGKVFVADISGIAPAKMPELAPAFGGRHAAPLLFTGGAFGTLARWPNAGYASFTRGVDSGKVLEARTRLRSPGAFVFDDPRAKRWDFAAGVWLNGYWSHDWYNHSVRAARYGVENGTNDVIRLAAPMPYGVMSGTWGRKDRRFYAFNLLEELDAPGEWWLDRAKKRLYLYPPNGAPHAEDDTTLAFTTEPLLRAEGVRHLRFERLAFEFGHGNGVVLRGDDLHVADCRLANLGAEGLPGSTMGFYFDDCDSGDEVYGNVFHNVARGIMVGGGRDHPIRNNVFSKCQIGLSIDCRGMTWKQWNAEPSWMLEDKAKAFDYTNGVQTAKPDPRIASGFRVVNGTPERPFDAGFVDAAHGNFALKPEAWLRREMPAFKPLPGFGREGFEREVPRRGAGSKDTNHKKEK